VSLNKKNITVKCQPKVKHKYAKSFGVKDNVRAPSHNESCCDPYK